ncbi:MAG: hypothetical protein AB1589_44665 [Cyanobacteriota bacterium]
MKLEAEPSLPHNRFVVPDWGTLGFTELQDLIENRTTQEIRQWIDSFMP